MCIFADHSNNEVLRLWKTRETYAEADGNKLAWVECICPSTGTHYFIDAEPHHTTALAAMASTWPGEDTYSYHITQHT